MKQIASPFQFFADRSGDPLDAGYIYIGAVNQNPETTPIAVYWDEAGTQPAAQPLRTSGGYIVNGTTRGRIYVGTDDYSMTIKGKAGNLVDSVPSVLSIGGLRADITDDTDDTKGAALIGYEGRTVRAKLLEHASVMDFGAKGDGVTDDTAAIQAAVDAAREVFFPEPVAFYRTTRPIRVGRFRRLYGPIGEYYQVSATPTFQRIGAVIRKEGALPFVPGGSLLGNGSGYTQDLNVNCVFLLHETQWPYRATDVAIENLGIEVDTTVSVASRASGIVAFRAVKSVFKNLNMSGVLNGIQGNLIDYAGIGKTNEGSGNNLDAYLNKVENVYVDGVNIGFDAAGTSWEFDRCYANNAIVGYRTAGQYSLLLNCACDAASDIAYWNQGRTTYIGCGQEQTRGNQLRDDGFATVKGWQVTNAGTTARLTTYSNAAYSATRGLVAADAGYNAIFSSLTVYEGADLSYTKATKNDGISLGYKGSPRSFKDVFHRPDSSKEYKMSCHAGLGMTSETLNLFAVGSAQADPIARAADYVNGTFPPVGTIRIVDMGAMWLVAGYANLSALSGDASPVRLLIESEASRYGGGNDKRFEFKPWSADGAPNFGFIPALGAYPDAGAGRRGSYFRTLDFVRAVSGGWNWSRVGGYDPSDGLIYMFNSSTGAQIKYNDAGAADAWTFTGWLPKVFPELPTS